jgi:hypothetical protein
MKTDTLTIIRQTNEQLSQLRNMKHDCINLPHIKREWITIRRRLMRRLELSQKLTTLSRELDDFAFTARSFFRGVTKNSPLSGLKRSRQSDRKSNTEFYTELVKTIRKLPKEVVVLLEQQTGKSMAHYRRLIKKWSVADRDAKRYSEVQFRADVAIARERLRLLRAVGVRK